MGGGLTMGEGANLVHLGVAAMCPAVPGCERGYPMGFVATPHFVDWISSKTGIPIKE